jgi:predicted AAA+ superfamily ATPase
MSEQALSQEVQEIWGLFREVARRQEETDKEIRLLSETVKSLTGKWGRFVEGLVAPGAVRMFRERGIEVNQTHTRIEAHKDGESMEIDVLVVNDEYAIAISVKSTLSVDDVNEHLSNLANFRKFFPYLADKKILGAVAGIVIDEGAGKYAYRRGLFVITQAGENIKILNDEKFRPKEW